MTTSWFLILKKNNWPPAHDTFDAHLSEHICCGNKHSWGIAILCDAFLSSGLRRKCRNVVERCTFVAPSILFKWIFRRKFFNFTEAVKSNKKKIYKNWTTYSTGSASCTAITVRKQQCWLNAYDDRRWLYKSNSFELFLMYFPTQLGRQSHSHVSFFHEYATGLTFVILPCTIPCTLNIWAVSFEFQRRNIQVSYTTF